MHSSCESSETQLILTCHDLAKVVNDSDQVDMLVLDFAKAFETVASESWKAMASMATCTNEYSRFVREEPKE